MTAVLDAATTRAHLVVEVRRHGEHLVLAVQGSVDATTGRALLNDLVAGLQEPGVRAVRVDLSGVVDIDGPGALLLGSCRSCVEARGARIAFTGAGRRLRSIDLRAPVVSS